MQTATERKWKQGDVHPETGKVFWSYRSTGINREYWVSPQKFEELRKANRAARRSYREANRERVRAAHRAWYGANAENRRAAVRAWKEANSEKLRAARRSYREANRESVRAYHQAYYEANSKKQRVAVRVWRMANPEKALAYNSARRAKKIECLAHLTEGDRKTVVAFYKASRRVSKCLGIAFHIDHIIPLAKGGHHHPSNLQILPARINLRKHAKLDFTIPTHD